MPPPCTARLLIDPYSKASLFFVSSFSLGSTACSTVFMFSAADASFIAICLEGFFYGLYSGTFTMYFQCASRKSRTTNILFYTLSLLFVLSTVNFVTDLAVLILEERSLQLRIDSDSLIFRLCNLQITLSGCCDFLAQCVLIYRCWIMWGENIRIVILPSFLAIVYIATWLTSAGATTVGGWKYLSSNATWQYPETPIWNATSMQIQQNPGEAPISSPISSFLHPSDNMTPFELSQSNFWEYVVIPTSLILSLAVNTLVTGLIVFKILKVFLEIKAVTSGTSVEPTLGVSSTGGGSAKYRHIIFVIIESGMALFAIQLIRVLFYYYLPMQSPPNLINILIVINQMFNGITPTIILVRVTMKLSFDDQESFKETTGSLRFNNNNPPSDPNIHDSERY